MYKEIFRDQEFWRDQLGMNPEQTSLMDASKYLKMVELFIEHGDVAGVEDEWLEHQPWILFPHDPLGSYLIRLMSDPEVRLKVFTSKLRAKMFYVKVGQFIADCIHEVTFQHQRATTEKRKSQEVPDWTAHQKHAHWEALFQEIDEKHREEGFDKAFFQNIFSDEGWKKQENWDKLADDWGKCMEESLRKKEHERIEKMKDSMRQGLDQMWKRAEDAMNKSGVSEAEALQAWNMMDGTWTETEFEKKMSIVNIRKRYPEIDEIVSKMGRRANEEGRDRLAVNRGSDMRLEHSSGSDIEGITIGDNLNALLPSELAQYADESMENLFVHKFLSKRLQTFRYKSESSNPSRHLSFVHANRKGPMIVCLDTSASMCGAPMRIEQSLLGKMELLAEQLNRPCFLIDFSVDIKAIDLALRRKKKTEAQLGFIKADEQFKQGQIPFIGGGTNAKKMFQMMFDLLENDGNQYVNADVLWVSDFFIPQADRQLMQRLEEFRQTGTRFYGLRISSDPSQETPWDKHFDKIYQIRYTPLRRY